MLGAALLSQKKYVVAAPLLADGYRGMKERQAKIPLEQQKVYLPQALERLVQLYDAWGKPNETAKWRNELEVQGKLSRRKKIEHFFETDSPKRRLAQ